MNERKSFKISINQEHIYPNRTIQYGVYLGNEPEEKHRIAWIQTHTTTAFPLVNIFKRIKNRKVVQKLIEVELKKLGYERYYLIKFIKVK